MVMPFFLASVYLNILVCYSLKAGGVDVWRFAYTGPGWMIPIFVILGCILGFGVRNIRVFSKLPWYYTLLIPLIVFVLSFLMVYIRIAGLMRCADGTYQMWLASQSDILAEDWYLTE
jgi:hyaluronan synthase